MLTWTRNVTWTRNLSGRMTNTSSSIHFHSCFYPCFGLNSIWPAWSSARANGPGSPFTWNWDKHLIRIRGIIAIQFILASKCRVLAYLVRDEELVWMEGMQDDDTDKDDIDMDDIDIVFDDWVGHNTSPLNHQQLKKSIQQRYWIS